MKKCCIFGAGEYSDNVFMPDGEKLIIACDGGYAKLKSMNTPPDIILGDFDSLGYVPGGDNVCVYPIQKDSTDMEIAVQKGLSLGCQEFYLYGSLGGEIDHTIANIGLLISLAESGNTAYLIGDGRIITAISNGTIEFSPKMRGRISVFAVGGNAENVTESGLLYSLNSERLIRMSTRGCGNEFVGEKAMISVGSGTLLVVFRSFNFPLGDMPILK